MVYCAVTLNMGNNKTQLKVCEKISMYGRRRSRCGNTQAVGGSSLEAVLLALCYAARSLSIVVARLDVWPQYQNACPARYEARPRRAGDMLGGIKSNFHRSQFLNK